MKNRVLFVALFIFASVFVSQLNAQLKVENASCSSCR